MKRRLFPALALAIACVCSTCSVQAEGWLFDTEATFFKAHLETGHDADGATDYEASPRLALTYMSSADVGVRMTYWEWNHSADVVETRFDFMDTYNLDVELVKQLTFTQNTLVEVTAGLRNNNTDASFGGSVDNFDGIGGLIGAKLGLMTSGGGLVYARAKTAILGGDSEDSITGELFDAVRQQTELGVGFEKSIQVGSMTITPRSGFEWQNWSGFAIDPVDEHADASVGFIGFVGGVGMTY